MGELDLGGVGVGYSLPRWGWGEAIEGRRSGDTMAEEAGLVCNGRLTSMTSGTM